jgi:hypothetical protein
MARSTPAHCPLRIKARFIVPFIGLQSATVVVAIVHGFRAPDLPSASCWLPPLATAA